LYILQKIKQHIGTANDNSFSNEPHFNLNCTINYLMQVTHNLCSKNTIASTQTYPAFSG